MNFLDKIFGAFTENPDEELESIEEAMDLLGLTEDDLGTIARYKANRFQFALDHLNMSIEQYTEFQKWRVLTRKQKIEDLIPQSSSFMQVSWLAYAIMKENKQTDSEWRYEDWHVHLDRAKALLDTFSQEEGYSKFDTLRIYNHLFYMLYIGQYGTRIKITELAEQAASVIQNDPQSRVIQLPPSVETNIDTEWKSL